MIRTECIVEGKEDDDDVTNLQKVVDLFPFAALPHLILIKPKIRKTENSLSK